MIFETPLQGQRFFVPEVVQTSAMDCGPAALKSILEGFGIPVSYGRLREACQTDVDGTSINTIEDIAVQLGLNAEQVMLPADHLALPEAQALPAIAVVQRPSGLTHFLVIWGRIGNFLQIMDPATGRRWPSVRSFLTELYIHSFPVSSLDWRSWAGSEGLLAPLRRRLHNICLDDSIVERLTDHATQDTGWRSLGTLDAVTRMMDSIVRSGGIPPGEQGGKILERFYFQNLDQPLKHHIDSPAFDREGESPVGELGIPTTYWSVLPLFKPREEEISGAETDRLLLRGAVLVRILGYQVGKGVRVPKEHPEEDQQVKLSPDLEAALKETSYHPEREVWDALKQDGLLTPIVLSLSLFLAAFAVIVEAILFQGVIQIGESLSLVSQRILAMVTILGFLIASLFLEFPINSIILRMGRRLETRLRVSLLEKIPRLGDRYFRSRLASDMTQRAHDLRELRLLPSLGFSILRTGFQLFLTMLGVIWLDPISAPFAILGTIFFIALSIITRPVLEEHDLRMRTHTAALSRFYLDALLGLVPIKTHGAERAVRRQHETQLFEWVRTGRRFYTMASIVQSIGVFLYSTFAILIVLNYLRQGGQANEILLLFYWTLTLPALGQSLANSVQQYPLLRNRVFRLLEPLGSPDEEEVWETAGVEAPDEIVKVDSYPSPVGIKIHNVNLLAGGHVILKRINLEIAPGEHVAIVGVSGAGKSSLVGLLLGWHRPSQGRILINNDLLDGRRLQTLRRETAWVDPAVQLWNRSLYENLRFGVEFEETEPLSEAVEQADLYDVLERLPDGMKTILGESGGLVSGGEGQRVRLGRAMLRPDVRLVILDEPFRGLDRERRRKLLSEARDHWKKVTLLCVTHDVGETLKFPRVLVIEDGQIVEDASPNQLAAIQDSRYRSLLDAELTVREKMWTGVRWKRLKIEDGRLTEDNLPL